MLSKKRDPVKEAELLQEKSLTRIENFASEGQPIEWIASQFDLHHLAFKRVIYSDQRVASAVLRGELKRYGREESAFIRAKQRFLDLPDSDASPLKMQKMSLINDHWKQFKLEFSKWSLTARLAKYDAKLLEQIEPSTGKNLRAILIDLTTDLLKLPPATDLRQRPEYLKLALPDAKKQLISIEAKEGDGNTKP